MLKLVLIFFISGEINHTVRYIKQNDQKGPIIRNLQDLNRCQKPYLPKSKENKILKPHKKQLMKAVGGK